jgi:hypothetical protein
MIRSPFATRMTKYGVRDMHNYRGKGKPPAFQPSKQELAHYEKYLELTA